MLELGIDQRLAFAQAPFGFRAFGPPIGKGLFNLLAKFQCLLAGDRV